MSERGPVELGTAACFGAAALLGLGLAARTRGVAPTSVRILYLLFAAGALFAGLEEISYGQHLIGWETPRWFTERNAQRETNLHNLFADRPGRALRNVALVAITLGGIVAPVAAMRAPSAYDRGRWPYYLLPRGELIPLAAGMLLMRLFRALPGHLRGRAGSRPHRGDGALSRPGGAGLRARPAAAAPASSRAGAVRRLSARSPWIPGPRGDCQWDQGLIGSERPVAYAGSSRSRSVPAGRGEADSGGYASGI